jgi:hypothetical protein
MKFKLWAAFVLVLVLAGVLVYGWWAFIGRWRPHTITKHQTQIAQLLEKSGWVSPALGGPKAYVIAFRACPDCVRFWRAEIPRLNTAGVDTRVIMIARRDVNGASNSSPSERSTVAELWANRSWNLLKAWQDADPKAWTAPGLIVADNDTLRSGAVELSRKLVEDLQPLLKDNGVDVDRMHYPTVIWWDKQGRMRACECEAPQTYGPLSSELGA